VLPDHPARHELGGVLAQFASAAIWAERELDCRFVRSMGDRVCVRPARRDERSLM
jgi:hypothetical protein